MNIRFLCVVGTLLPTLTFAAPDLIPDISQLTNGTIAVVNQSKDAAGASLLTIVCQKQGGGSCPESAGMAAYENPAYPNAATVNVPGIAPGENFSHALSFWNELDWAPGTYSLTVLVDAGNAVPESNEGNNGAVAQKVVLPDAVGNGSPKVDGFAAKPGRQKRIQPAGGETLVVGLPDIKGTTLGFVVKEPVSWGGSTVIENASHIKQIKAGVNQNLCIITTALYRTFNMGGVAVGNFIDTVYLNGTPVHTRHVPSLGPGESIDFEHKDLSFREGLNAIQVKMDANHNVPESNENNIFEIKVTVKHDCNGDGHVSGSPQIKNPSPGATPKKTPTPAQLKGR